MNTTLPAHLLPVCRYAVVHADGSRTPYQFPWQARESVKPGEKLVQV